MKKLQAGLRFIQATFMQRKQPPVLKKKPRTLPQPSTGGIIPNVCEYQTTNVPAVQQKPSGSFVLTSRPVDLFKAERDAALLAQALRRRVRRKRLKG